MTIASEQNRSGPYIGNGVTTIFNYDFRILDEDHIEVIRTQAGVETVLLIDTDYIVSDVGNLGGGQIALVVAPTAAQTITILRNVPFTQDTDLENQGPYFAETIEAALDLSVMRDQQLAEIVSRSIVVPKSRVGNYDSDQLINDVLNVRSDREYVETAKEAVEAAVNSVVIHEFEKKADAVASNPLVDPPYVRFLSQAGLRSDRSGEEWLGKKAASVPAHANYITNANGTIYERVPAQPHTPASITELGCTPWSPAFDNTVPFNKVITASIQSGFKDWFVPDGGYYFNSYPNDLPNGFVLRGSQNQKSFLYKNWRSVAHYEGILNIRSAQGISISDISMIAMAGSRVAGAPGEGCLISIRSDPEPAIAAGYIYVSRCILTSDAPAGEASTYFPLYVEGFRRTTGPLGVRTTHFTDCQIFGGELGSAWINGAVHFYWTGGGSYQAGGKNGGFLIDNESAGAYKTEQVHLTLGEIIGNVTVKNSRYVKIGSTSVIGNVWIDGTCNDVLLEGPQSSGAVTILGTNNRLVTPNSLSRGGGAGYVYLPGGQMMQWGVVGSVGTTYQAVNFPRAFTGTPVVTANTLAATSGGRIVGISAPSTTGFSAAVVGGAESINWIAIGPG